MFSSIGNTNTSVHRRQLDPQTITEYHAELNQRLVGWFDFSDASTVFEDIGGTNPAENADRIARINNKAYDGNGASSASLNLFAGQTSVPEQPTWTAPVGFNPGYGTFHDMVLESDTTQGNVSTGRMGGYGFTPQKFTFMAVVKGNPAGITSPSEPIFSFTDRTRADTGLAYAGATLGSNVNFIFNLKMNTPRSDSTYRPDTAITCYTLTGGTPTATANSLKWYVNGTLATTDTTDYSAQTRDLTENDPSVHFHIGWCFSLNRGITKGFDGRIYEVVMYDNCLNEYQLRQLHRYVSSKYKINMAII